MSEPDSSFSSLFGLRTAAAKRAYEFCANDDALDFSKILVPAFLNLGRALRTEASSTILCIQDTTELDLTHLQATTGLGEIGNPVCRGLFLHCGLAISTDGIPLGLLSALTWIRDPAAHGKTANRRQVAFDDKESTKWWKTITVAENVVGTAGRLLHCGDREGDVFDVHARADLEGHRFLFRAAQDRKLVTGEQGKLWATAESWPVVGRSTLEVPYRAPRDGKPARPARTAYLSLRYGRVDIAQPHRARGFISLWVVLVQEEHPPEGDAIEWLLLTNDALEDVESAWRRVGWYRLRWIIEEFHNCLKNTCLAEKRQFEERAHYEIYLALVLLVSARILYLRNLARAEPEMPAELVFPAEELEVLQAHVQQVRSEPRRPSLTLYRAVRTIAMLAGFMARKGDGEPGFKTLAEGYSKLRLMVTGYRLAKGLPPDPDPISSLPIPLKAIQPQSARSRTIPP